MGQPLSKTPMAGMVGVEIADYVPTGRTLLALMRQPLSKTPMAQMRLKGPLTLQRPFLGARLRFSTPFLGPAYALAPL